MAQPTLQILQSCSRGTALSSPSYFQTLAGLSGSRPGGAGPLSFSQALAGVLLDGGPFQLQQSAPSFSTSLPQSDQALHPQAMPRDTALQELPVPAAFKAAKAADHCHSLHARHTGGSSELLSTTSHICGNDGNGCLSCSRPAVSLHAQSYKCIEQPLRAASAGRGLRRRDAATSTSPSWQQQHHMQMPRGFALGASSRESCSSFGLSRSSHSAAVAAVVDRAQQPRLRGSGLPGHQQIAVLVRRGCLDDAMTALRVGIAEGVLVPTDVQHLLITNLCQVQRLQVYPYPHPSLASLFHPLVLMQHLGDVIPQRLGTSVMMTAFAAWSC